jgi:uncharacterized membrane protein YeaQ/YmgE (transglycosylase-associated protein family)
MEFLWMILIGLVAGALAKLFMPGDDPGGIVMTIVIGIAGAVIAGWLGRAVLGWYGPGQAGPGLIASIVGAMVLLGIYRAVTGRRPRHPGAV